MPVAERIAVDVASMVKLVRARKLLASSGASLAQVSMVAAGKMTAASVVTASVVASPVSTTMTAAAVSTGMTAAAMAAATVATTTFAP